MPVELLAVDGATKNNQASKHLFVMCESCYWCASLIDTNRKEIDLKSCPNCKIQQALSTVPITPNEMFTFSYSEIHGVELDFMPRK